MIVAELRGKEVVLVIVSLDDVVVGARDEKEFTMGLIPVLYHY